MKSTGARAAQTAGWVVVAGMAVVLTDSTPIGIVVVVGGTLMWRNPTRKPRTRQQDELQIRSLVADANAYQSDPVDSCPYTPVTPSSSISAAGACSGAGALATAMARALDSRLQRVLTRAEIIDIRFLRTDVALVSCVKHVTDHNADGSRSALPATASLTYPVVRGDGDWRIALAQTTPILTE